MPFTVGEYLNGSGLVVANNIVIVAVGRCRPNGKRFHHENKTTGSYDRTKMAVLYDIIVEVFTPNPVIEDIGPNVLVTDGKSIFSKSMLKPAPQTNSNENRSKFSRILG